MVNAVKQLVAGQFVTFTTASDSSSNIDEKMKLTWSFFDNAHTTDYERLMVIKSLLFCGVMARLAFQGDDSCVGQNEWFPWQQRGVMSSCGGEEEEGAVDHHDEGKKVE